MYLMTSITNRVFSEVYLIVSQIRESHVRHSWRYALIGQSGGIGEALGQPTTILFKIKGHNVVQRRTVL